jgi:hypothetical protein
MQVLWVGLMPMVMERLLSHFDVVSYRKIINQSEFLQVVELLPDQTQQMN